MADVSIEYTFKVPDEPFVDDFSENKTKTFTYIGPDVCTVTYRVGDGSSPYTQKIDGPVYPNEAQVDIDVVANPELLPIADLLWGRQYDVEATFDEDTLSDGTVYLVQNNMTIHDYYWIPTCNVNDDTGLFESWKLDDDNVAILDLFLRDPLSAGMRTYLAKADMFIEILDRFELSTDETTLFNNYKTAVDNYRVKVATPWKFENQNPFDLEAPKIPMELVSRHQQIKSAGLDNLMSPDTDPA
jgi:hypothetical protein